MTKTTKTSSASTAPTRSLSFNALPPFTRIAKPTRGIAGNQPGAPTMTRIRDVLFSIAFGLAIGALIAAGI
jgi:hypothetical protein